MSIGQQISLVCIELDVHGNIKLSLKAKASCFPDKGSDALKKGAPQVWASVGDKFNHQKKQSGTKNPVVTKYESPEVPTSAASESSFFIRSVAECDEEEKLAALSQGRTISTFIASHPPSLDPSAANCGGDKSASLNQGSKDKKSQAGSSLRAKDLKLGTVVTASVYQIRARGLVLDLGGGLKGMYRFEVCFLLRTSSCG